MATKLQVIKKVLGKTLEQEGFRYIRYKRIGYHHWFYGREDGEWLQLLAVVEHDSLKEIWVEIDEIKHDEEMSKAFGGFGLNYFLQPENGCDNRIVYKDMEEFEECLGKQKERILEYFLPGFKRLRNPRYKYCVTQEMEWEVYQNRRALQKRMTDKYGMKDVAEDELLGFIKMVLEEYKNSSMEEFEDTLLGLSAFLGESMVNNLEQYEWEWSEVYKRCRIKNCDDEKYEYPISIIFDSWQDGIKELEICYYWNFVICRKLRKAKQASKWQKGNKFYERDYMDGYVAAAMKNLGFFYDSWVGLEEGWKFHRDQESGINEIWFMRILWTGDEIWVRGVTSQGRNMTIRNIREGLAPYDGYNCCRQNDGIYFPKLTDKMIRQVEKEFLPMFDNEEEYLLEYDLTPEMEKRQMMERKELLDALGKNYPLKGMAKEDMPDFVKSVLKQNAGKSMEEFGDTLLGLGILLGEEAIRGREERHWLWDKEKETCFVTAGQEVFGIDPAFALNYAWQKQKPENVDRLCEDLFGDWEWIKGSGNNGDEITGD